MYPHESPALSVSLATGSSNRPLWAEQSEILFIEIPRTVCSLRSTNAESAATVHSAVFVPRTNLARRERSQHSVGEPPWQGPGEGGHSQSSDQICAIRLLYPRAATLLSRTRFNRPPEIDTSDRVVLRGGAKRCRTRRAYIFRERVMFGRFERLLKPTEIPEQPEPPAGLIGFYWHFARQAKGLFIGLFAAGFAVAVLDSLIPLFMGRVVSLITASRPDELFARFWPLLLAMAFTLLVLRPLALTSQNIMANQAIAANVQNLIRWQNHWHVVRQSPWQWRCRSPGKS